MTALPATTSSAGDDQPSADHLVVPPDQHGGEDDRPERLGRVQRRDDRHAAVVERREQEDVAEPEGDARGRVGDQRRAACPRSERGRVAST